MVKSDSQLIIEQIKGGFRAKDPHLSLYLKYVKTLAENFSLFDLIHVPRDQNYKVDLLSKLETSGRGGAHRIVIHETLRAPKVIMGIRRRPFNARWYTLVDVHLFRYAYLTRY